MKQFIELLQEAVQNAYDDGQIQKAQNIDDDKYFERCKELGHYDDLLKSLPATEQDGWVRCEDRLPETTDTVQAWHKDGVQAIHCYWYKGEWVIDEDYNLSCDGVTHWMPLPTPPTDKKS